MDGWMYGCIAKPFARHISVAFETTLGTIKDEGMKKTYPTPPSGMKLQCHPVGSRGKTAKSGRRRRPRNA